MLSNEHQLLSQKLEILDKIGKFGANNDLISGRMHKSGCGAARLGERGTAAVSSLANADPYISHHLFYLNMFLLQVPSTVPEPIVPSTAMNTHLKKLCARVLIRWELSLFATCIKGSHQHSFWLLSFQQHFAKEYEFYNSFQLLIFSLILILWMR